MKSLLYAIPCTVIVWTMGTVLISNQYDEYGTHGHRSRLPLAGNDVIDCIPSGIDAFPPDFFTQEQRQKGGVIIHVIIVCYVCAMTAIVCDEYFVPALEVIASKLKLSPDVAGATFMAMGASAPELFSSIADAFLTEDDIGLGTILGSAVFNILGISGIVGIVLWNKELPIQWYPVARDCVIYGLTVLMLSFIISDNIVRWWEALTLLTIFATYIVLMHFNPAIERVTKKVATTLSLKLCCGSEPDPERGPLLEDKKMTESSQQETSEFGGEKPVTCTNAAGNGEVEQKPMDNDDSTPTSECCCLPVWRVLMWIPFQLFRFTIPPVRYFPATFILSILWMGGLSYIAVWMVTVIGYTLSIPDAVSGLTLLAAGSSIPDLIATVLIAKSGQGNMAVSNLLGSNTFDLAFCLGAPWFVKTLTSGRGQLLVYSSAMLYTVVTLLVVLFALLLIFQLARWRLNRTVGIIFFTLYVVCITLACLYELNVFGVINKPTCS